MSFAQYHLPRAKPPKAISPTKTMTSPIQKLHTNIRTIPTITMMPPSDMPAIPRRSSDPATPSLLRVSFPAAPYLYPLRNRATVVGQAPGLLLLGGWGQRLIGCPLLDAALDVFQRWRCSASWMPNYPYDLANAPAPAANYRSPFGRGQTLAVSAAAVTDHVCDSGHGLMVSKASLSGLEEAHSGWGQRSHGICGRSRRDRAEQRGGGRVAASRAAQPDRRLGRPFDEFQVGIGTTDD